LQRLNHIYEHVTQSKQVAAWVIIPIRL
jgi:hypothetical protein